PLYQNFWRKTSPHAHRRAIRILSPAIPALPENIYKPAPALVIIPAPYGRPFPAAPQGGPRRRGLRPTGAGRGHSGSLFVFAGTETYSAELTSQPYILGRTTCKPVKGD